MTDSIQKFMIGFMAPLRGLKLSFTLPGLFKWCVIPFLLTALVFIIGGSLLFPAMAGWIPAFATWMLTTLGMVTGSFFFTFSYWLALLVAWPVAILALLYGLFLITRVVAAPFYSLLAERSLMAMGVLNDEPFNFSAWLAHSTRMLVVALLKAIVLGLLAFVLFVLSFIPAVGVISAFGFLLIAAFDIVDFSLEALRMGFRARFAYLGRQFFAISGFAAALGLVFLVPGLNFVLFPAAIVGAGDVVRRLAEVRAAKELAKPGI